MSGLDLEQFSTHLQQLNFNLLFTDALGWNHPPARERTWQEDEAKDISYRRRMVAELAGVAVLEIITETGWPDEAQRMAIWRQVSQSHYENLLIFLDRAEKPTQSLWYWVKRTKDSETGKPKNIPRRHEYFRGQPVDLFASKLQAMVVELYELDASGRLPVLEVARRMESALDVEKTTKRFFTAYQEQHGKGAAVMSILSIIQVKNFKAIRDSGSLKIKPFTVLIGNNGMRRKLRAGNELLAKVELELRLLEIIPAQPVATKLPIKDREDPWIIACALAGKADCFVTGNA